MRTKRNLTDSAAAASASASEAPCGSGDGRRSAGGGGGGDGVLRLYRNYGLCAVLALAGAGAASAFGGGGGAVHHPSSSPLTRASPAAARGKAIPPPAAFLSQRRTAAVATPAVSSRNARFGVGLTAVPSSTALKAEGGDGGADAGEWTAVVESLRMYKAAYGDLKVPSRFVVPGMPPWPEAGWGLKLGQRVSAIRSTGKYNVQSDDARRSALDDMGFLWRLRSPSGDKKMDGITFDQIYVALETYKSVIGSGKGGKINVPANFVVPNADPWPVSTRGLPLGKKIPAIRSKAYLKSNPGASDKLNELGFEFDGKIAANDQRYKRVYDALVRYKELNGDLLVPQPFVIPEDGQAGAEEWNEDARGLRLGARVNAVRSQGTFVKTNPGRRRELDELGFVWDLPAGAGGKKRGRKKKTEIEALMGPAPPGVLAAPEEVGGAGAGAASPPPPEAQAPPPPEAPFAAAASAPPPPSEEPLFPFAADPTPPPAQPSPAAIDPSNSISPDWAFEDDLLDDDNALGDAEANAEEEYPQPKDLATQLKEAADVAASVGVIREMGDNNRIQKGKIQKQVPWYLDDFGRDFVFEDVVEALAIYREMHGGWDNGPLDEPEFVIPDVAESLFEDQGLRIPEGALDAAAGAGAAAEDPVAAELERIELEMRGALPPGAASLEMATEASLELATEDSLVPAAKPSVEWPEHLAGLPLGSVARRIRDGSLEVKHDLTRRRALDAIGFDWGDSKSFIDVPFEKTMCALLAYHQIRGDAMVYEDYVVPDEVPWPTVLAGFELGKAVLRIRQLQNFFEAYHPEKVRLLSMVDFYWFPEFALPLDPFSFGETVEDEFVAAVGVPFYWLGEQENYPPGIAEKLIADGPNEYPDDTAKWYNYELVRDFWEAPTGTEVIKMFDEVFGFHLPSYVLRRFGLPKLAKFQEAKFASGQLGEIAGERLEVEKQQDDLLRPLLMSMSDLSQLKERHEELNAQLSDGEIDDVQFEKERTSIEWKVEDIVGRLQGISKEFKGGLREEAVRVVERTEEFGAKLAKYESEVEGRVENMDEELQKRFPDYDKDEWDRRQKSAAQLGAAEFAKMVGDDEAEADDAIMDLAGADVEVEEEVVEDDEGEGDDDDQTVASADDEGDIGTDDEDEDEEEEEEEIEEEEGDEEEDDDDFDIEEEEV